MGDHYLKHQGRVYVGAALTWDMLLYVKMEANWNEKHYHHSTKRNITLDDRRTI